MQEIIMGFINEYGYLAILLLIALENIFPPIPSEVILCFAGFATITTNLQLTIVIIYATLGSTLGAMALYYLGIILCKEKLAKILHLKNNNMEKAERWFEKRGNEAVLIR